MRTEYDVQCLNCHARAREGNSLRHEDYCKWYQRRIQTTPVFIEEKPDETKRTPVAPQKNNKDDS